MIKIALVQSTLAWGDVDANLENFGRKITACKGYDIILLPEMFTSGCMMVKKSPEVAVAEKTAVARRFVEVEEKMRSWAVGQDALVIGSTVYAGEGRYYNRLIAAFPEGHCLYYDKRHCFRMGGENEHFTGGDKQVVFDFRGIRIAAFICYDLRFPVWSRNVQGYDLAVYIANWPASRSEAWKTLLKARAIENQAYVAGVNCVGMDANGLYYSGDSVLIDAKGDRIADVPAGEERVVSGELNPAQLQQFRKKFAVLDDRDRFSIDI